MPDDPFEAFKKSITGAKAPPPPRPIPTPEQAEAESLKLYAEVINAIPKFDALAKDQDAAFSVAWRRAPGQQDKGFPPITRAIITARKWPGAKALEIMVQMQDERFWGEDPALKAASGNGAGKWTPDRQNDLITAIGERLTAYFNNN